MHIFHLMHFFSAVVINILKSFIESYFVVLRITSVFVRINQTSIKLTGFVASNDEEVLYNNNSDIVVWNEGDPDLFDVELKSCPYRCLKHSWIVHWDLSNYEEVNYRYQYQLQIHS